MMLPVRILVGMLLTVVLLGPLPVQGVSAAPTMPVASITSVLQTGLLLRGGSSHALAATPFTPLYTGDHLRTGVGQHASILLRDGSQFLLNQNTDLGIAFPVLHLYHGEIFGRVPHTGVLHAVVGTDAAVAAVEGTQFDISVGLTGGSAHTVLTVVEGSVRLSNALGSVLVGAAQQAMADPNRAPSQPVVVPLVGIIRWTSQVRLISTVALPPHYPTPRAATVAGAGARARLVGHPGDAQAHLTLADALADAGAAPSAQREYGRALVLLRAANHTDRGRALAGIAAMAFVLGNLARADAVAGTALIVDPTNVLAGMLRGDVAVARSDLVGALVDYALMHKRHPTLPGPLVSMGMVLVLQRQDKAATAALLSALGLHPPGWLMSSALLDLGDLAGFEGDLHGELAYALRAVKADPQSAGAWINVGTALSLLGRYGEALQPLTVASRLGSPFERASALDNLGEEYYELGQLRPELAAYRAALALSPRDPVAANGAGTAELAIGQNDAAIRDTRRAVQAAPTIGDLSADYARALWADHQYNLAEEVCRRALRSNPHDANLYLVLGFAYDDGGQAQEAHASYARAYALRPSAEGSAEDAALAGQLAFYAGHLSEARADLQRSAHLHPAAYLTWQLLALVDQYMHDYRASVLAALRGIALDSTDLVSRSTLALSYQALGEDTAAMAQDRAILRLYPHQTTVHEQIAIIAHQRGDLATAHAEAVAEIAVQNEPTNRTDPQVAAHLAADWAELGLIEDDQQMPRRAVAAFAQAVHYDPHAASYYRAMGLAQRALGQPEQAIASFSAAIRLNPHDENALYDRGAAEATLGRLTVAARDLRDAVALSPHDAAAHEQLAIVLMNSGDYRGASDQSRITAILLKGQPGETVMWAGQGNALDHLGDYRAAITAYRHAVEVDPHNTVAHSGLGLDLARTAQYDAARVEFTTVLAQQPQDAFAYFDLAVVDQAQGKTAQALQEVSRQIAINHGKRVLLAQDERELGLLYAGRSQWHEAANAFGHVIVLGSRTDVDYFDLGYAQEQAGDRAGALAHLRTAHSLATAARHGSLVKAACTALSKIGARC